MNSSTQSLPLHHLRTLQPAALQTIPVHQSPDGTLHLSPDVQTYEALTAADANNALFQQQQQQQQRYPPHALHASIPFDGHHAHPHGHGHGLPHTPTQFAPFPASYQHAASPRFDLTAAPPPQHIQPNPLPQQPPPALHPAPQQQIQPQPDFVQPQPQSQIQPQPQDLDDTPVSNHGQFEGLKLIPNPPNLDTWRAKLFHVDDTITLTEEEFQTYFPHVDNVYSHRSTQRHKRKRFVSHYWDCRLKGRPPGTKKSTDPDKKKRKRVARERDLCDVKIKITEFYDARELEEQTGVKVDDDAEMEGNPTMASDPVGQTGSTNMSGGMNNSFFGQPQVSPQQAMANWNMPPSVGPPAITMGQPAPPPAPPPQQRKYYTIQRVNGNGGNGKGDGVAGPHKHTLDESDRVKKNSVVRWLAKIEKDKKKIQGGDPTKKTYHKKTTGNALTTVKTHSKDEDLKLFGSCFCPFVQRVWISLEHKQIPYQYIEVDPYKKPQSLLEINPRGLVPAIRHGPTWSTHESTVIMEYLEDLNHGPSLFPSDVQTRATSRLWTDHVNRHIVPCFYRLLQAQDPNDQINHATELRTEIGKIVDAADSNGPFFLGPHISFVDVQMAPWVIRLRRVLGPYRGWPEPEEGSRWKRWVDAIENDKSVKMTTSDDGLYLDSYERYAENRPGTSELANAVNSGRGLP